MQGETSMSDHVGDPVARRFDHMLALTAYGLLFISLFTLWIPALVAAAIAVTHRREADWRTASHFRFQLTIFLVALATGVLGLALLFTSGGFAVAALWTWSTAGQPFPAGATAGVMALAGAALFAFGWIWTAVTSLWGAYRLATDRAIGQSAAGRALEPR
jgi:uncharacterized membrane protein